MDTLRQAVIKLAKDKPELRKHLIPILRKVAIEFPNEEALKEYMKEHPDADPHNHSVKKEEPKKEGPKQEKVEDPTESEIEEASKDRRILDKLVDGGYLSEDDTDVDEVLDETDKYNAIVKYLKDQKRKARQ